MHIRYRGITITGDGSTALSIRDFTPPTTEVRHNKTMRLLADGSVPGREFLGDSTWSFDLAVEGHDAAEVLALAGALESAWKADAVRLSNDAAPLEYRVDGGEWFRIYGRPSTYTGPKPDYLAHMGTGTINLDFIQTDPLHYRSAESTERVSVVGAQSQDGFLVPFTFPLTSTVSGGPRAGRIWNRGDRPAPLRARIQGPCTDPRIWSDTFEAGYRGTLAYDQSLTIDTTGTTPTVILRGAGRGPRHVAGDLTRKTRLKKLALPPGESQVWFEAEDMTGTSYADLFWRDTSASMQRGANNVPITNPSRPWENTFFIDNGTTITIRTEGA